MNVVDPQEKYAWEWDASDLHAVPLLLYIARVVDLCCKSSIVVDPVTKIHFEWPRCNGSRTGVVKPGDAINCSADGRPQPSYTW